MSDPVEVLDFWLGAIGPAGWYAGGDEVDGLCREGFGDLWQAACDGGLDHWAEGGPAGALALIVICDQFARNIWRGDSRAFSTDPLALRTARHALAQGWDMEAPEPERQFFYMPFEHSEDPADQALAVQLMTDRMTSDPEMALHARAHQAVIARFGRFPFRNAVLGRESSPEERLFMEGGGYASMVNELRGEAMQ